MTLINPSTCFPCASLASLPNDLLVQTLFLAGNPRVLEVCRAFKNVKDLWFQDVCTAYFETRLIRQMFSTLFLQEALLTVQLISIQFITLMKQEWLDENFKDISPLAQHQSARLIEDWSSIRFFETVASQLDTAEVFFKKEINLVVPKTRMQGMQQLHAGAQKIERWIRDNPELLKKCTSARMTCEMPVVPRWVARMTHLTALTLTGCKIIHVMNEIGSMIFLEKLDLSSNRLKTLPKSMQFLSELRELYLSDNRFESLPSVVCELENLNTLNVSGNAIKHFMPRFCNLKKMRSLNFSWNAFMQFPWVLSGFSELSSLIMEGNQISYLPHTISLNINLLHLDLRNNPLTQVPSEELFILVKDYDLELLGLNKEHYSLLHPDALSYFQERGVLTPVTYDLRNLDGLINT